MKAKRRLLFQILAVVLLVAIGYTMTIIWPWAYDLSGQQDPGI